MCRKNEAMVRGLRSLRGKEPPSAKQLIPQGGADDLSYLWAESAMFDKATTLHFAEERQGRREVVFHS